MIATIDEQDITVRALSDNFPAHERFEEIRRLCTEAAVTGNRPAGLRNSALVLPLHAHGRPRGFIYVEPTTELSEQDQSLLRILAQQCSIALENLRLHMNVIASHNNAVDMLAEVAEFKDKTTGQHINRIDTYTRLVAIEMGVGKEQAEIWGKASRLHDVGKIGIPDHILAKPGKLDQSEYSVMKRHADIGAFILRHDDFFDLAREVAYSHHERWDGAGYPQGRPAREFSLVTRIVSVVDVFDAMVSRRPYKEPWPAEQAIAAVEAGAGSQFDPDVVAALVALYRRGALDAIVASTLDPDGTGPVGDLTVA
jgi:HD-GYP domain-containing protein (c-di-GMP phosphodiesterase class II)